MQMERVQTQINPAHILTPHLFKIHLTVSAMYHFGVFD
jgi:hypothetical protein